MWDSRDAQVTQGVTVGPASSGCARPPGAGIVGGNQDEMAVRARSPGRPRVGGRLRHRYRDLAEAQLAASTDLSADVDTMKPS